MLKKVAITVAVLLILVAGGLGWLWHQATALPDWYTEEATADDMSAPLAEGQPPPPPQWIALDERGDRIPDAEPIPMAPVPDPAPDQTTTPKATPKPAPTRAKRKRSGRKAKRHELRGLHRRRTAKGKDHGAVKASRAVYEDGALELGVILDLSRLPKDKLTKTDRARYDRAVRNFPGITGRDVWVGVEDHPVTVEGYLQLSPQAEVRVGKLTYSMASAAKRLGMPDAELRMQINRELRRLGLVDPEA